MEGDLPTEYDVIVVGTGLVECMVAAAAARIGKKVLHVDKNHYYGVEWASFTLEGAQQWVEEVTATPPSLPPEECELEDGEQLVGTRVPSHHYSRVKQTWHVPKEPLPSPAAPEVKDAGQEENTAAEGAPQDSAQAAPEEAVKEESQETTQPDEDNAAKESGQEKAEDRKQWSQEELLNLSRRFNLDLAPKLLYSRGPMVELLISSNIARYVEFKCISRVLTWCGGDEDNLLVVPCSRSDVFTTNAVSLVEKRLLMKFLEFCHEFDQHPEQVEEYLDGPFVDFLRSRKLTDNLIHFVTEAIGMVGGEANCRHGLERTKAFLTSLGRYGTTPFLFSMYGSGELPQAFCRLCAVFEGIYILRKPVSSLIVHSPSNTCRGLLSEGQRFTCSHLVMSVSSAPQEYLPVKGPSNWVSRGIFLTDRSVLHHEKEQLTLLRLPAKDDNPVPVTVMEVGHATNVCPKDLYCVHMTCQGKDAENDLQVAAKRLLTTESEIMKPKIVWSLYFNQADYFDCEPEADTPKNVYLCPGPNTDLDYDLAIEQARSIFGQMFPGEDFLPRAPDPDEIAFDNQGTEPKQGDTFEGKGSTEGEENKAQGEDTNVEDGDKEQEKVEQGKDTNGENDGKEQEKEE